MKLSILLLFILLFNCCSLWDINLDNPSPEKFVKQLKNGTYNQYYKGENGKKLWTLMPKFDRNDIPALLKLANDTALICPCDHFPVNSISSITPARYKNYDASCIMIGEYLLWCIDGIIQNTLFPSLIPKLKILGKPSDYWLNGKEVLEARELYMKWWEQYRSDEQKNTSPLENSNFKW